MATSVWTNAEHWVGLQHTCHVGRCFLTSESLGGSSPLVGKDLPLEACAPGHDTLFSTGNATTRRHGCLCKLCDGGQYLSFTVPSHLHIILVTTSGPICTLCSGKPLPPKGGSGVGIYRPGRGYPQVNVQMGSGCFSMDIWRLHTGRRECAPRAIYTIQNSSHRDSESSSPNLHVLLRSPKTVQSTPPNIH